MASVRGFKTSSFCGVFCGANWGTGRAMALKVRHEAMTVQIVVVRISVGFILKVEICDIRELGRRIQVLEGSRLKQEISFGRGEETSVMRKMRWK